MTDNMESKLIANGLKVWEKNGMRRIYTNGRTAELIGLKTTSYGTGNIKSASFNGKTISNSQAKKILSAISGAYYDCNAEKFVGLSGYEINL